MTKIFDLIAYLKYNIWNLIDSPINSSINYRVFKMIGQSTTIGWSLKIGSVISKQIKFGIQFLITSFTIFFQKL